MLTPEQTRAVEQIEQAQAVLKRGDAQGILKLEELAAAGHGSAMIALGIAYEMGEFRDDEKAEEWYRAAYSAYGDRRTKGGILYLGYYLYRNGRIEEAKQLFAEGAAEGHAICMYLLSLVLLEDESSWATKKSEVRRLLEQASEQSYPLAERALAILLMKGRYGLHEIPLGVIKFIGMLFSTFRIAAADLDDPRIAEFHDYGPRRKQVWRRTE